MLQIYRVFTTQWNHINTPLNHFSERVQQGFFLSEVLKLLVELS